MLENVLVIYVVLRKEQMRTARNIFILNLSLSDLLLAISVPFTVFDALTRSWHFPSYWLACKYVKGLFHKPTSICLNCFSYVCYIINGSSRGVTGPLAMFSKKIGHNLASFLPLSIKERSSITSSGFAKFWTPPQKKNHRDHRRP